MDSAQIFASLVVTTKNIGYAVQLQIVKLAHLMVLSVKSVLILIFSINIVHTHNVIPRIASLEHFIEINRIENAYLVQIQLKAVKAVPILQISVQNAKMVNIYTKTHVIPFAQQGIQMLTVENANLVQEWKIVNYALYHNNVPNALQIMSYSPQIIPA